MINKNILANFIGVGVTTALTLLVVPFYLRRLGSDAYGLIGVATMIQGWMMLLNAGLAPVAGRMAAEAHIGAQTWQTAVRFFRTIDWLLIGIAAIAVLGVACSRNWLALHWLGRNGLGTDAIATSIVLLVAMTLQRLATSVSRGIVANLEEQVWLNGNLVLFNLLRFAASLLVVQIWPDVIVLFSWWLLVSIGEYVSVQVKLTRLIPVPTPLFVFDWAALRQHGKMAATLATTSGIWVVITNLDKLLLSGMLTLADYGYFSVATVLAAGILSLTQPISQAFQPRLTKAYAQGGIQETCTELRRCTHLVELLIIPVGAVIFAAPEAILFLWTGDHVVASHSAGILRGYAFGSTLIALGSLLYVYQVAIGNVRWHLWGNLGFALLLFPTLPIVVRWYGALGAAWLWAGFNLFLFLFWNAFLLWKLAKPLFPLWLIVDAILPVIFCFAVASGADYLWLQDLHSAAMLGTSVVTLTVMISAMLWFGSIKKKFPV